MLTTAGRRLRLGLSSLVLLALLAQPAPAQAGTCSVSASATASGADVQIHAYASCTAGVLGIRFFVDGTQIAQLAGGDATATWHATGPAGTHTFEVAAAEVGDPTWSHPARAGMSLAVTPPPSSGTTGSTTAPSGGSPSGTSGGPPGTTPTPGTSSAPSGPAFGTASNPATPTEILESGACRFDVPPGAWVHTGVKAKSGDAFSISGKGTLSSTTDSWGPSGFYLVGFYRYNLKAKVDGGASRDIGSSGTLRADMDGEVLLGTGNAYEPSPDDTRLKGSFSATLFPCVPPPATTAAAAEESGCPDDVLPEMPPELTRFGPAGSVDWDLQAAGGFVAQQPVPQGCSRPPIKFAVLGLPEDQPFVDYARIDSSVMMPASLDAMAAAIQDATRYGTKIRRLYFLAHGGVGQSIAGPQGVMEIGTSFYDTSDFVALRQKYPNLSDAFPKNAVVTLLNCDLGNDPSFVAAVADVFLHKNGGYISAKTGKVAVLSVGSYYSVDTPDDPSTLFGDGDWLGWRRRADADVNEYLYRPAFESLLPPPEPEFPPPDSTISPE